jgi:hypothetical protein
VGGRPRFEAILSRLQRGDLSDGLISTAALDAAGVGVANQRSV